MASPQDLAELSRHLKQERLFINSEREQLQCLNEEVRKTAENLYHVSWIARQQKLNLDQLILGNPEATPEVCCRRANALDQVRFVDGYKHLSYHESKFGEFLKQLRENPRLVAACMVHGEKISMETMQKMARLIMASVYGNTVMPEDEAYILQVLKSLIEMQIATSDNPRRLLRKGSCAFSIIFKLLNEGLFSAKLFLTAALHKPVMQLLMEDEWFYDIDPERALYRFPPQERTKRFSQPGTPEYEQKIKQYREVTASKLTALAERFITSIKNNMYCFPPSLSWIVSQLYHSITKAQKVNAAEARAMCADLVFAMFICPAICDPEPYGITSDAPISYIARHNLMQVAQILQVLAISAGDEIDPKTRDLYAKFEKGCMSTLLDALIESSVMEQPPQPMTQLQGCARSAILMTVSELTDLLNFLRNLISTLEEDSSEHKSLEDMMTNLPPLSAIQALQVTPTTTPQPTPPGTPQSAKKYRHSKKEKRLMLTVDQNQDDQSDSESTQPATPEEVLVISLGVVNECPGMLAEQKVLDQDIKQRKVKYNSLIPGEDDPVSGPEVQLHEKRTRFSLSHDQDSIATSDNLEAISEAASSHSVGSDLENENDNLSDMVSANVSGRGTPNISGRDTPLSQSGSQPESVEERPATNMPNLPVTVQKTNREDVTEKFGKFEIKAELERDETKSTVSDTWSTDVLASDSEPAEQNQLERLEEVAEDMLRQNLLGVAEVSEMSETASDAWSTDVLASDTSERQADRLLELEQDDAASISSRSQGPDDSETSEPIPSDHGEDTPQASGQPSPNTQNLDDLGAIAGDLDEPSSPGEYYSGQSLLRSHDADPKPPLRPDRFSDPAPSHVMGFHNPFDDDHYKGRPVSDLVGNYHQLGSSKNRYDPNPRVTDSFKYAEGKVGNILQSFDPLSQVKPEGCIPGAEAAAGELSCSASRASGEASMGSSTTTLVLESILSPDQGIVSPGADLGQASSSTTPCMDRHDRDSGMPPTPQDGGLNLDSLSPEPSGGLKLTEQQNVNIDAQRLSGTISLFDPLITENSFEGFEPIQRLRTSSESMGPPPQRVTPINRATYNEQGARPKIPPSGTTSTPRISLQVNSLEINDYTGSAFVSGRTASQSGKGDSVNGVKGNTEVVPNGAAVYDKDGYSDPDFMEDLKRGGDLSNVSIHSNDSMPKSRSSTESSTSSLVESTSVPSPSTAGKSITFEASGQKAEEKEDDEKGQEGKKKPGFFLKFRERFRETSRRKLPKALRGDENVKTVSLPVDLDKGSSGSANSESSNGAGRPTSAPTSAPTCGEDILSKYRNTTLTRSSSEDPTAPEGTPPSQESTDDILNKYRKQPASSSPGTSPGPGGDLPLTPKEKPDLGEDDDDGSPPYDPNNLESCKAFLDAKKKLRLVLSTADFQALPAVCGYHGWHGNNDRKDNELVSFLKVQLAEAINLQDKDLIAQLHETIRCLRQFDHEGIRKLLKTMKEEYRCRSPYIAYLVRCRQGLLSSQAHLHRLLTRVKRDKTVCNKYFLSVFVRMFLERREKALMKFIAEFQRLTVSDEKTDLVEQFLEYLHKQMEQDPIWQAATDYQLDEAKLFIERNVMSHIYTHAMYPNGDGDILRDQILHEHMKKLARVITPNHKALFVAKMYHYECPWPAAQAEIYMISAYKTPKDKLQCVLRCSSTIMNLLSMANEKSVPAADDFMPVLIFVLIKANPPSLLSTVQYVNSFYGKRLCGEEQYWWMQFSAAIEFIKTMDYTD